MAMLILKKGKQKRRETESWKPQICKSRQRSCMLERLKSHIPCLTIHFHLHPTIYIQFTDTREENKKKWALSWFVEHRHQNSAIATQIHCLRPIPHQNPPPGSVTCCGSVSRSSSWAWQSPLSSSIFSLLYPPYHLLTTRSWRPSWLCQVAASCWKTKLTRREGCLWELRAGSRSGSWSPAEPVSLEATWWTVWWKEATTWSWLTTSSPEEKRTCCITWGTPTSNSFATTSLNPSSSRLTRSTTWLAPLPPFITSSTLSRPSYPSSSIFSSLYFPFT